MFLHSLLFFFPTFTAPLDKIHDLGGHGPPWKVRSKGNRNTHGKFPFPNTSVTTRDICYSMQTLHVETH